MIESELVFSTANNIKEDYTNKTIGDNCLVLGYAGKSSWYIKCHCGEIFVKKTNDINGTKKRPATRECLDCSYKTRGEKRAIENSNKPQTVLKDLTGISIGEHGYVIGHLDGNKWECLCGICNEKFVTDRGGINGKTRRKVRACKKCTFIENGQIEKRKLVGQKFGRLTVVGILANNSVNHSMFFCKCDCMAICKVSGQCLKNGDTRSCGCLLPDVRAAKEVNLIGRKVGDNGVVLDKVGKYRWKVKCGCGLIFETNSQLIKGSEITKPIYGCLPCSVSHSYDILRSKRIGQKFGRLEILDTVKGKSRFICKCDCGNIKEVSSSSLLSGSTKSCGCLHSEISSAIAKSRPFPVKNGEEHPNWNPYLTDEDRKNNESRGGVPGYSNFRNKVLERYDNTCVKCGY